MKNIILCLITLFGAHLCRGQSSVEITEGQPFHYVYMEIDEPHSSIYQKIGEFSEEIREQGIESELRGNLFGIFFDAPIIDTQKDTVWGLGYRIDDRFDVLFPLKTAEYNFTNVIRQIHKGPYETVGNTFNIIIRFIEANHWNVVGPPVEIWLDDPNQVEPADCRTEIIIPVQKNSTLKNEQEKQTKQ